MSDLKANAAILKQVSILMVDDEDVIIESLLPMFDKIFNFVFVAKNGEEAYQTYTSNKDMIDIVLSDYNMPKKNGMDLLRAIREDGDEVPFIFLSAFLETNILIEAIKLGVYQYCPKPLNMVDLLPQILKASRAKLDKKLLEKKQKEIDEYLNIVDQIAIISKTDTKGIITFVNDVFCTIAGYEAEELLGKPHSIVRHPDVAKDVFKDMWETIEVGKIWKGKVKNRTKCGETYIVNATIFPIFEQDNVTIKEYMAVRFLTTEDENKAKEMRTNFKQTLMDARLQIAALKKDTKFLSDKVLLLEESDYLAFNLSKEQDRNRKLVSQHEFLEKQLAELTDKNMQEMQRLRDDYFVVHNENKKIQEKFDEMKKELDHYKNEVEIRQKFIDEYGENMAERNKRLMELNDVIKHKEQIIKQLMDRKDY